MQIFGIGIDVVEVGRIAAGMEKNRDRYLGKIFTAAECAYCNAQHAPELNYAARFAAKEAVAKAFGTGIGKHAGLHDIEILRDDSGVPRVHLYGAAKEFAQARQISDIQISLTHARDYAAANAIALCRD